MDPAKIWSAINRIVWPITIAVVSWFGTKNGDGGFIKDIWATLQTASPPVSMVLFLLWLDERRERRESQRQCNDRTIDFIQSTNSQSASSLKMGDGIKQLAANLVLLVNKKRSR